MSTPYLLSVEQLNAAYMEAYCALIRGGSQEEFNRRVRLAFLLYIYIYFFHSLSNLFFSFSRLRNCGQPRPSVSIRTKIGTPRNRCPVIWTSCGNGGFIPPFIRADSRISLPACRISMREVSPIMTILWRVLIPPTMWRSRGWRWRGWRWSRRKILLPPTAKDRPRIVGPMTRGGMPAARVAPSALRNRIRSMYWSSLVFLNIFFFLITLCVFFCFSSRYRPY